MLHLTLNVLLLAIVSGQLIKLPLGLGGATLLDLVVVSLVAYLIFKTKFKFPKLPLWVKAGLLFSLIALLSLIISPLDLTFKESLYGFLYIVRFSSFILLGWLIHYALIPAEEGIHKMLLNSGILLAIFGLLQFIFLPDLSFLTPQGWDPHYFRATSTFLDPNFLGAYMVLTLVTLTLGRRVLFILVYLTLLTTFSRGAYLAFLVAFLTLSFTKRSLKLGLITILLFGGLMLGFYSYHHTIATPRGIDRALSAEARLDTWQQGLTLFITHPILGVGFNAYRPALKEYKLADEGFLEGHGSSTNDSSLLFVAATTGIIGLTAYLFFLGTLAWQGWKKNPVLLAGLTGLLIQSFFANTLFYPFLLLWPVLMCYYLEHGRFIRS